MFDANDINVSKFAYVWTKLWFMKREKSAEVKPIFSNAMLSYYQYFLFTLFYVFNNSIKNGGEHRLEN